MSNYQSLKTGIQNAIKTNGNNEITGQLLQQRLLAMIDSLGVGYQYMGVATPSTNPGTLDQRVFYIAKDKGTYSNFGGLSVTENDIVILYYDSTWRKAATGIARNASITELTTAIGTLSANIGNLSQLHTQAKNNLVAAINEVADNGGGGGGDTRFAERLQPRSIPADINISLNHVKGGVGSLSIDRIKGNRTTWCQMCNPNSAVSQGITRTVLPDGRVRFTGTATADLSINLATGDLVFADGEKYLAIVKMNRHDGSPATWGCETGIGGTFYDYLFFEGNEDEPEAGLRLFIKSGVTMNNIAGFQLFDLGEMFGVGNEPTTIEEFNARKPVVANEYAFDLYFNSFRNAISSIVVEGFNLWNEQWEMGTIDSSTGANIVSSLSIRSKDAIAIDDGTLYYIARPGVTMWIYEYGDNGTFIGRKLVGIDNEYAPSFGTRTIRFILADTTTYGNNICINVYDAKRNGVYRPYIAPTEIDLSFIANIKDSNNTALFPNGLDSAPGNTTFDEIGNGWAIKKVSNGSALSTPVTATFEAPQMLAVIDDYCTIRAISTGNSSAFRGDISLGRDAGQTDITAAAMPVSGFVPGVYYDMGVVAGSVAWKLAPSSNVGAEYIIQFSTGATAPSINWGTGFDKWIGGNMPTINANKTYQVSVVNGLAVIGEF